MPDLSALIERLEKASGSDREIDCLLWAIQEGIELEWQGTTLVAGTVGVIGWCDPGATARNFYTNRDVRGPGSIPALTASIDAALAFAKRFGFYVRLEPRFHIDGERVDFISYAIRPRWADYTPLDDWFDVGEGRHADQALAILISALKALQEREGEGRATDML